MRWVGTGSLALSVGAHTVLLGLGAYALSIGFARGEALPVPPSESEIAVELAPIQLPVLHLGPPLGEPVDDDPTNEPPLEPGGGEPLARPDMERAGRGGAIHVDSAALNLADRNDGLTLSREVASRVDRDQIQRLDTARERASYDDRRATTHPMDLVFLATGTGHLAERRPIAKRDPSQGALAAAQHGVLGSAMGSPREPGAIDPARDPGGSTAGGARLSPGQGILSGARGDDHRASADVARGRPRVTEAAPSIPSDRAGRPRDTVDSEQEVAATVQSIVHASTAGGTPGAGPGGENAQGPSGSDGVEGPGSRAAPFGGGTGPFTGISDADPRVSAYRRSVLAKIYPLWENAFPKAASLEGKQGRAIVSLVIFSDGHVESVVIARASGVPEFDDNVRRAVVRAAPFAPFPSSIPGPSMKWKITFDMTNPVVR